MKPSADDYAEITNLLAHYCLALDHDDLDSWRRVFTPDGELQAYGRSYAGEAGLRQVMEYAPKGLHLGGPPAVEIVSEDRARTQQNLLFIDRNGGAARSTVYHDELHRTADGWKIHIRATHFIGPDGLSDRPPK